MKFLAIQYELPMEVESLEVVCLVGQEVRPPSKSVEPENQLLLFEDDGDCHGAEEHQQRNG